MIGKQPERKQRKKLGDSKMECLAAEIVSSLLSRLPAKDLMRCKCVCKFWFELITDTQFISNYYVFYNSQEVQQQEHMLLIRTPDDDDNDFDGSRETEISVVSLNPNEPRGLVSSQVLNLPSYPNGFWKEIMGPCNGIYFLKGHPNIIMNPSLGQFIVLPESHFTGASYSSDYPRFGFDPKTNDYKVVMITCVWAEFEVRADWKFELYSLNSNSWKILEDNPVPFPFGTTHTSGVFTYVNDCCHWWGSVYKSDKDKRGDVENAVLSFDMVSELFKKIKVPQITHSSSGLMVMSKQNLIPLSESATIGVLDYYCVDQGIGECFCYDVWMMKDYWDEGSWIKRYSVGPIPIFFNRESLWYTRERLLFYGLHYGSNQSLWDVGERLVLYGLDGEEHTTDLLDCVNYEEIGVVRYMESLVSLRRGIDF